MVDLTGGSSNTQGDHGLGVTGACPRAGAGPGPAQHDESDEARVPRAHVALDLVEVAGIEPASDDVEPGLLRAQSAADFLGPRTHADKMRTGSVT